MTTRIKPCTATGCRHPECAALSVLSARGFRASIVYDWVLRTFGDDNIAPSERIARFVEEALELAQACGMPAETVLKLLDHVYAKPTGTVAQEIGGVGTTLLALAKSHEIDAESEEVKELLRVLALDPEHFRARHNAKADAGVATRVSPLGDSMDIQDRAYRFAIEQHGNQKYGGLPYSVHLAEVVGILKEFDHTSREMLAAGWLHDTIEDTATSRMQLELVFGLEVADLVWACTGVGLNRKTRNVDMYAKLRAHPRAISLKLADRLANVQSSPVGSKYRQMYKDEWPNFWAALYEASQAYDLHHGDNVVQSKTMWNALLALLGEP